MHEDVYRFSAIVVFLIGAGISTYQRRKADRKIGERISPRSEGLAFMIALRFIGLSLWLGILLYLLDLAWMAWSRLNLPAWARWIGVGLGVLAVPLAYWVFSHLGKNVSPSVATQQEHRLVTSGPYRWVRHPLYSMGMVSYLGFALLSANWFIAALSIAVFILLNIRLPREEAELVEKFGDEYREVMRQTGRFLPRFN